MNLGGADAASPLAPSTDGKMFGMKNPIRIKTDISVYHIINILVRDMRNLIFVYVILLSGVFFVSTVNAKIFSWVDENGTKHFSNTMPPPDFADNRVSVVEELKGDKKESNNRELEVKEHNKSRISSGSKESQEKERSPKELAEIDRELRGKWNGLKDALKNGNID